MTRLVRPLRPRAAPNTGPVDNSAVTPSGRKRRHRSSFSGSRSGFASAAAAITGSGPAPASSSASAPKSRRRRLAAALSAIAASPTSSFSTFLIVGPTCFFLGVLFSMLPYDYEVLWSSASSVSAFDSLETHLRFLYASPPLIGRMVNGVIAVGLVGFFTKLWQPAETNVLFDGAALVLYLAALVVYLTNFVNGLAVIAAADYGPASTGTGARDYISREDSLRVMAASNTIMALLLVGILILQAGQWYAAAADQATLRLRFKPGGANRKVDRYNDLDQERDQDRDIDMEQEDVDVEDVDPDQDMAYHPDGDDTEHVLETETEKEV